MQLHLTFKGDTIRLPIAYRSILQGLIYNALRSDPAYSSVLHDQGRIYEDRSFKHFTFSLLSGSYRIEGKNILFAKSASMEIRSVDERFISLLSEALPVGSSVDLGKNRVEITQSRVTDYRLLIPSASISLTSPVIAYLTADDGSTRFFSPSDDAFLPAIIKNARRKWMSLHGCESDFELHIEPLFPPRYRKEATIFKHTYLTAWYGEYRLYGAPEVVDMLYQVGLGAKSSQGFGIFSLK